MPDFIVILETAADPAKCIYSGPDAALAEKAFKAVPPDVENLSVRFYWKPTPTKRRSPASEARQISTVKPETVVQKQETKPETKKFFGKKVTQ